MDDYIQINDINTTTPATIMPGTWSAGFDYTYEVGTDSESDSDSDKEEETSPMCGYANTMGDGTVHKCNPTPPNCPLGRPLVPGRNIDDGLWSLPCSVQQPKSNNTMILALAVLVVALALTMTLRT